MKRSIANVSWLMTTLLFPSTSLSAQSRIRLETEVTNTKYCAGDDEIAMLHLGMRLQFKNIGDEPVILYRIPSVGQAIVGRSEKNENIQNREFAYSLTVITSGSHRISRQWPNNAFVVLRHGETFSTTDMVPVPVKRDPRTKLPGASEGEQLLQIHASVWPDSSAHAARLRNAWKLHGFLWSDSILSVPMRFNVAVKPVLEECGPALR